MRVAPEYFFDFLKSLDVDFFTGVPDSTLKEFTTFIETQVPLEKHIVVANEGNSIALATGYHLATGKIPLIYMQNSGFGNSINPLLSLADPAVYSIPMIIMVGWRGEKGTKDEPQHKKQGDIQIDLLESLKIPYCIFSQEQLTYKKIESMVNNSKEKSCPCVILVKRGTFDKTSQKISQGTKGVGSREATLELILSNLSDKDIVVSTTGKTSREIFEIREKNKQSHKKDFLMVGSMGHVSSISLGIALNLKNRNVFCIDGDGSFIMHMGALSTIGKLNPSNFRHIVLNNYSHESVGSHKTAADSIDILGIAKANNYSYTARISSKQNFLKDFDNFKSSEGPSLIEIIVDVQTRSSLGRPSITPKENKGIFMEYLRSASYEK